MRRAAGSTCRASCSSSTGSQLRPDQRLRDPGLPKVCDALAARARTRFADAERHFGHGDRRALRPALVMMHVYRRTLDRLIGRGWRQLEHPVRLPRPERLWLALRYGLL